MWNLLSAKMKLPALFQAGQKIPVQKLTEGESKRLKTLKKFFKRVIGQDEAVAAVAKAIRRGRIGLGIQSGPLVLSFPRTYRRGKNRVIQGFS